MRSDLPADWQPAFIGDLINQGRLIVNDGYRAKNSELGEEGLPFARAGNLRDGFHLGDADHLATENIARAGTKISMPEDVVFTSKGTVGRFAFVRSDTPTFVYSPQLCFWRVVDRITLDPRFLFMWMYGPECVRQFTALKGQTDMADYISLRDQHTIRVLLPPIDEQTRISTILGVLDDKIDSNRRLAARQDRLCMALFEHISHDDPVPGVLGDYVELIPGRSYATKDLDAPDETTGLLTLKVVEGGGGFTPAGIRPYSGRFKLAQIANPGDIIVAHTDLTQRATVLGSPAIVRPVSGFDKFVASMHVPIVRPRDQRISTTFLYYLLRSPRFHEYAYSRSHGTTVMMLSKHAIAKFTTAIPNTAVLARFDVSAGPSLRQVNCLHVESETLTRLREDLLPRLISGQIRVPDTLDPEEVIGPAAEEFMAATR
jgi:type I restriction enzyme S subunit